MVWEALVLVSDFSTLDYNCIKVQVLHCPCSKCHESIELKSFRALEVHFHQPTRQVCVSLIRGSSKTWS